MKVLVTGGAGYIGNPLVQALSASKEVSEVVVYDNLSRGSLGLFFWTNFPNKDKVRFIQGDILDSRKLRKCLKGVAIVYHLAAKVTTPFSDKSADFFEQVNHWGTAELCYAIEESEVQHLVYLSSAAVYGSNNNESSKISKPEPITYYGHSKLRGEAHVSRLSYKIKTHIVRCSNTFGFSPSMRLQSVINNFTFKAHNGEILNINGNGRQTRAFVHIDKVVNLLVSLLSFEKSNAVLDLVDYNLSIEDIIFELKQYYPLLQYIYVNQHIEMRELFLKEDQEVVALIGKNESTFNNDLGVLISHFSTKKPD